MVEVGYYPKPSLWEEGKRQGGQATFFLRTWLRSYYIHHLCSPLNGNNLVTWPHLAIRGTWKRVPRVRGYKPPLELGVCVFVCECSLSDRMKRIVDPGGQWAFSAELGLGRLLLSYMYMFREIGVCVIRACSHALRSSTHSLITSISSIHLMKETLNMKGNVMWSI